MIKGPIQIDSRCGELSTEYMKRLTDIFRTPPVRFFYPSDIPNYHGAHYRIDMPEGTVLPILPGQIEEEFHHDICVFEIESEPKKTQEALPPLAELVSTD